MYLMEGVCTIKWIHTSFNVAKNCVQLKMTVNLPYSIGVHYIILLFIQNISSFLIG